MYELHFDGLLVATADTERGIFLARRTITTDPHSRGRAANFRSYVIAYPPDHTFPMMDDTTATAASLPFITTTTPE